MKKVAGVSIGMFSALTLGLVLLLLGVVTLFGITEIERGEALKQIPRDRERLVRKANTQLSKDLHALYATLDARIAAALKDPFADTSGVVSIVGSRVVLPRIVRPNGSSTTDRLMDVLEEPSPAIDASVVQTLSPDERDRLTLAKHAALSPASYRAWLDHRLRHRLRVVVDLATTLFVIEQLDRHGGLSPSLANALLRDGLEFPEGRLDGLFTTLLYGEEPLARGAAGRIWQRARTVAKRYTVRVDDVELRRAEATWIATDDDVDTDTPLENYDADLQRRRLATALARPPEDGMHYDCDAAGCVVVAAVGDTQRALYLNLNTWSHELGREWRREGQLPHDADIDVDISNGRPTVAIKADQWAYAERLATERFVLKASGLGVVALLGIGVFVMAIMLQRRRTAYIELRGQLISAVTHELKTPLASISALAQTLEMRYGSEPQARDYATRIVTSADRLGYLVDNVLSFTRLERGAWKPRFDTLHPSEIATLLAEPITRAARPVDLALDVDDVPFVADRELIRLMLSNLVDNAAKYATADRVAIKLTLRTADKTILHFADDGPGLGERDPRKLFDDFRRGKVDDVRGTGLGLSICRWVARLHGGTIAVAATSPTGTTFVVTLAKHKPAPQEAARRP